MNKQKHLAHDEKVNQGSYYTSQNIINALYKLLEGNITNLADFAILDSSCGYGAFLNQKEVVPKKYIGGDIDIKSIKMAKTYNNKIELHNTNALFKVSRKKYGLKKSDKLIIIGNPPYNDTTSFSKKNIKSKANKLNVDIDLKARDMGISFLRSYDKLMAEYVCVLHPLSYLIKKANFDSLKSFNKNYRLIDSIIISSHEFEETSKIVAFPIIIALYKRDTQGMDFEFIQNYRFKTIHNKNFCLNDFDYIGKYIPKYPNKKKVDKKRAVALFWTMRDINALKRNKTFINKDSYNAVLVTKDKLPYYCYVDVFKKFIEKMPYYFGNLDIIIEDNLFKEIENCFEYLSLLNNKNLKNSIQMEISEEQTKQNTQIVNEYFKKLLGEHCVHKYDL